MLIAIELLCYKLSPFLNQGTSSQGAGGGAGGTDPSEQTELLPGCGDRSPERRDGERSPERSPERHPERHNLLRADKVRG